MKKKFLYEIILSIIIPLVIWNISRKQIGDYYAMLLTTLPGFIYTIWKFFRCRQFNVTGVFILITLILWRTLDIISHSAEGMLWNGVYINIMYSIFWIITIIIKKPMGMYFFVDYAYLKGYSREASKELFMQKKLFRYFQYFTGFLVIKDLEGAILKAWFIKEYGVSGFNKIIIYMNINGYIFAGMVLIIMLFIEKKIKLSDRLKQEH